MISHSRTYRQGVPRMTSFKFSSLHNESLPYLASACHINNAPSSNDDIDNNNNNNESAHTLLNSGFSYSAARLTEENNNSRNNIHYDGHSPVEPSQEKMVLPEVELNIDQSSDSRKPAITGLDRRRDRKSQARRYLVEGLSNNIQHGANGRRLYRSHTFSITPSTAFDPTAHAPHKPSTNHRHSKDSADHHHGDRHQHHHNHHHHVGHWINPAMAQDSTKVKKAIENWNEIVLELNSEQLKRLSFDSDSSSNEDVPSPLHKGKARTPLYSSNSILPPSTVLNSSLKGSLPKTSKNSTTGFSFARYRPITPNLLIQLDKNKLSSRKKTQRWVDQLQVQCRSYSFSPPRQIQRQETETPKEAGGKKKVSVEAASAPSPSKKAVHRTESYGSNKTLLSGSQHHSKRQHSDFI